MLKQEQTTKHLNDEVQELLDSGVSIVGGNMTSEEKIGLHIDDYKNNILSLLDPKRNIGTNLSKKSKNNLFLPENDESEIGNNNIENIKKLITLDNNGVLKIINNDYFENIDYKELEIALLEKIDKLKNQFGIKIKLLDISGFNQEKYKYLKEKIFNILGNNFPLLEVARLQENVKVVNITFNGVKTLNDNVSKEFVDLFVLKLKEFLYNNFSHTNGNNKFSGRIIRSNYKHITFSLKELDSILEVIFGNKQNKKDIFEIVLNNIFKDTIKVDNALKNAKIKNEELIRDLFLQNFDFGIGTSFVEKSDKQGKIVSQKDKLKAFYQAEIIAKNKFSLDSDGKDFEFDFSRIKEYAKNAINQESEIIKEFNGIKFDFDGTLFDVITNVQKNGKIVSQINPLLLRYVRKGENIGNQILFDKVNNYISNLNDGFDFIAPFIKKEQLDEIFGIEKQIQKGIIDIALLQTTYKNILSFENLKVQSKGKDGLRIFVDIVDMGIMNLHDFRKLAGKVNDFDGTIEENLLTNVDDLLEAGSTATIKFQNLVIAIKNKYKDAKISLGGDEIFLFIPGKTSKETNEILNFINGKLRKEDIVGRLSSSFDKNNHNIFDNLDSFTSIDKVFEKVVEKTIYNNIEEEEIDPSGFGEIKKLGDINFSSISIDILSNNDQKLIRENIGDFILDLKNSINYDLFKDLLLNKINNYKFEFDVFKRDKNNKKQGIIKTFNLNITKGKNNRGKAINRELKIFVK